MRRLGGRAQEQERNHRDPGDEERGHAVARLGQHGEEGQTHGEDDGNGPEQPRSGGEREDQSQQQERRSDQHCLITVGPASDGPA